MSDTTDVAREAQHRFDEAERTADLETLRELIAEDLLSIGPRGFLLDKDQWIGRHRDFRYDELVTSEVDVRSYGDTAVLRDVQRNGATWRDDEVRGTTAGQSGLGSAGGSLAAGDDPVQPARRPAPRGLASRCPGEDCRRQGRLSPRCADEAPPRRRRWRPPSGR